MIVAHLGSATQYHANDRRFVMKSDGTERAKRKLTLSKETLRMLTSNGPPGGVVMTTPDCKPPPTTQVAPPSK
jgi:hypothetical protein